MFPFAHRFNDDIEWMTGHLLAGNVALYQPVHASGGFCGLCCDRG